MKSAIARCERKLANLRMMTIFVHGIAFPNCRIGTRYRKLIECYKGT
jgi:hypothetical protein